MHDRRPGSTLRVRLLVAFVGVAAVAIAAFAGLTLWSAHTDVQQLVRTQQRATASNIVGAVAYAYRSGSGWTPADLRTARAITVTAGALLEVRDQGGMLVLQAGRGLGPGGPARLRGAAHLATTFGTARVMPIVVGGKKVGSASIRFPADSLPPAERQLRDALTRTTIYGILVAATLAVLVGFLVADGITRPLRHLITAVRRLGGGDRSARVNLAGAPGELGELAAAVDTMAAALEREDELRRALTADVAHELRTPVTILTAQCEAMLDGVVQPTPEQLVSLHDEALRLARVIEDLEALASAEAAGLRLERSRVDVAAVVEQTASMLRPQFDVAEVELVTQLEPASIEGDQLRLIQVVRNLLTNALKFTPAGGRVVVSVGRHNGSVDVSVSDTGVGIRPDQIAHVFDRFWRGANGRSTSGSGIGLAVVDELVRAHGGDITVSSEPSRGSVFTAHFPLAK